MVINHAIFDHASDELVVIQGNVGGEDLVFESHSESPLCLALVRLNADATRTARTNTGRRAGSCRTKHRAYREAPAGDRPCRHRRHRYIHRRIRPQQRSAEWWLWKCEQSTPCGFFLRDRLSDTRPSPDQPSDNRCRASRTSFELPSKTRTIRGQTSRPVAHDRRPDAPRTLLRPASSAAAYSLAAAGGARRSESSASNARWPALRRSRPQGCR